NAMLRIRSKENVEGKPLWIYKVGPESVDSFGNSHYDYAIASSCIKSPVAVLVRNPDTFKDKYEEEVRRWLKVEGFLDVFGGEKYFPLDPIVSFSTCQ
ncbi:hypothetical protein PFISCL1PPCAC_19022, partial [Pristionchus fissidentatus]